jgi:hypothetical protein
MLFKKKGHVVDDELVPYNIPATYGAEYDEYDYFYTKLPSDTAKWQWYYQKCDSCGKYHRLNFYIVHYFYCWDGWDSMDYADCWKCRLKSKLYSIQYKIKQNIKRRKEYHKMIKMLKKKDIPITKELKEMTKKICR